MPFNKKTAKKAGKSSSRQGIPNKANAEMKDAFKDFIDNNTSKMQELFDKVALTDPAKAIDLIHKFSDFFMPKLSRTEIRDTTSVEYLLSLNEEEQLKLLNQIRKDIQDAE